jgi:fucose 4-O-acetylase-like acetyltransferase
VTSPLTGTVQAAEAHDRNVRTPMLWGAAVGAAQVATPLAFWWLSAAVVYALGIAVIAAIYVGFAVADGRPKVILAETGVAFGFILLAAAAITGSPWLLVLGLGGHAAKDLWQHRSHFVSTTRWWPPFCAVVDLVAAAAIAGEIAAGTTFH